jgi:hypothetical protein
LAITRAALLFALIVGDAKAGAPNDKSTVAAIVSKV